MRVLEGASHELHELHKLHELNTNDSCNSCNSWLTPSHRVLRVSFQDYSLELWRFTPPPQPSTIPDAIEERTSVRPVAALERTWNANKLGANAVARDPNDRIPVTTHIDEREMRR